MTECVRADPGRPCVCVCLCAKQQRKATTVGPEGGRSVRPGSGLGGSSNETILYLAHNGIRYTKKSIIISTNHNHQGLLLC